MGNDKIAASLAMANRGMVCFCLFLFSANLVAGASSSSTLDEVVTVTLAKAELVREARLAQLATTDFTNAHNMHTLIPADQTPESQVWTGKGFQLIGAAIGSQFHGKNASAMEQANALVQNMTINFRYNGYVPTSESGCSKKALGVFCNGTAGNQTESQCQACAEKLKHQTMTCHILHNPVMTLPIYNCD